MLLLIKYDVISYMHVFFTVKNTLVLLLMVYRLFVLFEYKSSGDKDDEEEPALMKNNGSGKGEYVELTDSPVKRETVAPSYGTKTGRKQ